MQSLVGLSLIAFQISCSVYYQPYQQLKGVTELFVFSCSLWDLASVF